MSTQSGANPHMRPPTSTYQSPIIKVVVGTDDKARIFEVFKDPLCHYSSYFHAMLNSDFKEAQERFVELREDDPEVNSAFHYFLFRGSLYSPIEIIDPESDDYAERTDVALDPRALIEVWLFGDARGIPAL